MKRVLPINGGSSTIKFALFEQVGLLKRSLTGAIERIGLANTVISANGANGPLAKDERFEAADIGQAGERLIGWLGNHIDFSAVQGVGHRVVHGGPHYSQAQYVTPELIEELKRVSSLDPDHLPGEIALINILRLRLPGLPQVACFDTAFHHDMPRVAQLLPVPRRYESAGARRYGFHGLSYTSLLRELERVAGSEAARGLETLVFSGGIGERSATIRARIGDGLEFRFARPSSTSRSRVKATPMRLESIVRTLRTGNGHSRTYGRHLFYGPLSDGSL